MIVTPGPTQGSGLLPFLHDRTPPQHQSQFKLFSFFQSLSLTHTQAITLQCLACCQGRVYFIYSSVGLFAQCLLICPARPPRARTISMQLYLPLAAFALSRSVRTAMLLLLCYATALPQCPRLPVPLGHCISPGLCGCRYMIRCIYACVYLFRVPLQRISLVSMVTSQRCSFWPSTRQT